MQNLQAYTATFWVYKTKTSRYEVIHDQDSLCHFRMDGSVIQIQQNYVVDQTDTFGHHKILKAFSLNLPYG